MTKAGLAIIAKTMANPLVAANVPQNIAVTSDPEKIFMKMGTMIYKY